MDRTTPYAVVVRNMILIGLGLGTGMQTFVLVVQNAVSQENLGVATASVQLARSVGASVGTAIFGAIMTQRMTSELVHLLPAGIRSAGIGAGGGEGLGAGAVLDPRVTATLPPEVLDAVRSALATALHSVYVVALPFVLAALLAVLFLREIPLRRTVRAEMQEVGKDILAEMNQAGAGDVEPILGTPSPAYRGRLAFLGLVLARVADQAGHTGHPRVRQIAKRVGEGDESLGQQRLRDLAQALLKDCNDCDAEDAGQYASLLTGSGMAVSLDPAAQFDRALGDAPPGLRGRLRTMLQARNPSGASLSPADLTALERIGMAASAALLLDLTD